MSTYLLTLALACGGDPNADAAAALALARASRDRPKVVAVVPAPAQPKRSAYQDALAKVMAGTEVTIYVGRDAPKGAKNALRMESFDGNREGVFRCFLRDGEAQYERVTTVESTAPILPPEKTVGVKGHEHKCPYDGTIWSHADGDPNASHSCPKCGRQQLTQYRDVTIQKTVKTPAPAATISPVASGKPKRVVIGGYYYDQYPDGTLVWCVACNAGR